MRCLEKQKMRPNYLQILDERVKIIYRLSKSVNANSELFPDRWFNIDGLDYFIKDENRLLAFFNELIGELLAKKVAKLKSAEYSIARITDERYPYELGDGYKNEGKLYHIISKNFKEKDKTYFYICDFISKGKVNSYKEGINLLEQFCINKNNFIQLKKELFKFLILGFFTSQNQWDFKYNFMLAQDKNFELQLGPTFDYTCSFDFNFISRHNRFLSYFGSVEFPSDMSQEIIHEYPENIEVVKEFINLNANEFFKDFEKTGQIKLDSTTFDFYVNFCEEKQNILSKCL